MSKYHDLLHVKNDEELELLIKEVGWWPSIQQMADQRLREVEALKAKLEEIKNSA